MRSDTPGQYRITVQGLLDASYSERLAGMRITRTSQNPPVTALVGRLRDQAELSGVLDSLYTLHLPILTVKLLDSEGPSTDEGDP